MSLRKASEPNSINELTNPNYTPWTKENVLAGFNKFYEENGRYPTAREIDRYPYLPSSRQIQRTLGGLVALRKELGMAIPHYNAGEFRSKVSVAINQRGSHYEREFEKVLIEYFGEYFVHGEKLLFDYLADKNHGNNKTRLDFLVYSHYHRFGIDVLYARESYTWTRAVDIKLVKYRKVNIDIYIINLNESSDITDEVINHYITHKQVPLESHIKIMNKSEFVNMLPTFKPLKVQK